jgi:DNA-binding transcriptional ArsR family regulator
MSVKKDGDYGTMHRILKILAWRYATAKEISELLGISRQAVHYHLRRLIEWGFVVRSTKKCIMAECIDGNQTFCIYVEGKHMEFFRNGECNKPNERGKYYVYAVNYYVRKLIPSRPFPSAKSPPEIYIDIIRNRLRELGVLDKVKGYDLFLMAGILQLMVAVLWNPKPRGESYWVRLKHLTSRGIHRKIGKFISWYISMKAAIEARKRNPKPDNVFSVSKSPSSVLEPAHITIAKLRKKEYYDLFYKYSDKYYPTLGKIRWILARMYDYLMVERLGGSHCPYGIWVPHPSLFTPDGKPDFHLPRHRHINAKHRYKSLNVKQSFTEHHESDNQTQ